MNYHDDNQRQLGITKRWTPMRYHAEQDRLVKSQARFKVVPAGRRSGKTELVGKRNTVIRAMMAHKEIKFDPPYNFGVGAPTRDQAKRIYWTDLKKMVPEQFLSKKPNESNLELELINGAHIKVIGMDRPERIEGSPWDGFTLDEYGNMKRQTWTEHLRPALSDRLGWANFVGVPEGRNHYFDLWKEATSGREGWDGFTWFSSDILPASEIESAKEDLDELTYQQEYEGSFINFTGAAYYKYSEEKHLVKNLHKRYAPEGDLIFCFDFNVSPGVAVVCQEMYVLTPSGIPLLDQVFTAVIGEVRIKRNSNTQMVCNKLIEDWGGHEGRVYCYGDATGGSKGSAKVMGSDWELIKQSLKPVFGDRLYFRVTRANPPERDRVNAVNARLENILGSVRVKIDAKRCKYLVKDLEGVVVVEGGSGELDKKDNPELTHISDAFGYYIEREYPIKTRTTNVQQI